MKNHNEEKENRKETKDVQKTVWWPLQGLWLGTEIADIISQSRQMQRRYQQTVLPRQLVGMIQPKTTILTHCCRWWCTCTYASFGAIVHCWMTAPGQLKCCIQSQCHSSPLISGLQWPEVTERSGVWHLWLNTIARQMPDLTWKTIWSRKSIQNLPYGKIDEHSGQQQKQEKGKQLTGQQNLRSM